MAVTEETLYYPSENLILKQPRRHFRTSVTPLHWQLRSLIGTGPDGVVYFPTGTGSLHLQKLDTTTLETETVHVLSFSPRCLVAKNGRVCCGGETGEFIAINLGPQSRSAHRDRSGLPDFDFDVDVRLPLDPSRSDELLMAFMRRQDNFPIPAGKKFGRERVNCITLWFPPQRVEPGPNAYRSPVAVLANNDKHVTLVELETLEALDEIEYPDCVNRAVLSPDGGSLVAVGDDPYLYVHERIEKTTALGSKPSSTSRTRFTWREVRRVHLKSQHKDDRTDQRGSFAACFSNTGTFLAVGTQYGIISIFNTSALLNPEQDPLLTYFPSSRPTSPDHRPSRDGNTAAPGAVREMAFSPGPYDLLAWSEDRGRVGIADLRTGFASRQILYLDSNDSVEHLELTNRIAIDPRLLEGPADRGDTLASNLANRLDLGSEARRGLARRLQTGVDLYHYSLTGEETRAPEAAQDSRRRREQQRAAAARELLLSSRIQLSSLSRLGSRGTPASNGASAAATAASPTAVPRPRDRTGERGADVRRVDWARASRDHIEQLIENLSSGGSEATRREDHSRLREESRREAGMAGYRHLYRELLDRFVRETDEDALTSAGHGSGSSNAGGFRSATMRAAVRAAAAGEGLGVGDAGGGAEGGGNGSGNGSRSAEPTSAFGRAGLLPPRPGNDLQAGGYRDWAEPGGLFGISLAGGEDGASTAAAARRGPMIWESLINQVANRADSRDSALRSGDAPLPDETAGLSWSEDGSLLYVGAENGIYEFRVNIASRKLLPSMTLR